MKEVNINVDTYNRMLTVNGVKFTFEVLDHILNPDPTMLYSFDRNGENIYVTQKSNAFAAGGN